MKIKIPKSPARRGIVILRDTREVRPIVFTKDEAIAGTKRQKLHFGDYQALYPDDSRSEIVFERKSVGDLWTTMTRGHGRFMAELERAKQAKCRLALIVEAPFSSVLAGFERSKYPGTAMVKKLWTLFYWYNLPSIFCQNRQDMSNYIAWSFIAESLRKEREK